MHAWCSSTDDVDLRCLDRAFGPSCLEFGILPCPTRTAACPVWTLQSMRTEIHLNRGNLASSHAYKKGELCSSKSHHTQLHSTISSHIPHRELERIQGNGNQEPFPRRSPPPGHRRRPRASRRHSGQEASSLGHHLGHSAMQRRELHQRGCRSGVPE